METYKHKVYYIIVQKSTEMTLPNAQGRRGRGFTQVEPTHAWEPRLFSRLQDAKCALTWWLKGVTTVTASKYESMESLIPEYDEVWHTEAQPDRNPEDYVIRPVKLLPPVEEASSEI